MRNPCAAAAAAAAAAIHILAAGGAAAAAAAATSMHYYPLPQFNPPLRHRSLQHTCAQAEPPGMACFLPCACIRPGPLRWVWWGGR